MTLSANSSFFSPLSPPCRLSRRLTSSKLPVNPRSFNTFNSSVRAGPIALTTAFSFIQLRRRPQSAFMSSLPSRALTTADPKLLVFDSDEELLDSLANYTADLSKRFCEERGAFTVVLSGGSLIKSLRKLIESPYSDLIDWGKWHVFWIDERVVPKDHPDSNYKLAFDEFLSKVQIPTGQVYAINDSVSAEAAAEDYENRIKQLVCKGVVQLSPSTGFPKFDLMLLGMGPDGHIASLFPGHPLLHEQVAGLLRFVTHQNRRQSE
ncbi:hypothetical protein KSP40_PGU010512 [Platanthera guangdongensis]|uniref:Probable 6-phosphogluconolactonase n=1 Tax=Platanthera guangdongensis TaxID=2320717 RepID=A0ABR2MDQ2_9ASPA